ncbi:DUF3040 domain-containing protein [Nocardioides sp. CER19]|uniref:DUF3040 domain-containing protein n=1 Tax=Nocardioides sp. CER19 TaxID=3038538 RepID=UPI00244BCC76|nr:DUF3040 domain-containing protein [Nocardioides sp. CER19]MDH2416713.1 DUF3040 domain-containing protein [Nocardioides sp. CER19]
MPLSEEELRLLEQMERALLQEDPKFASTLRGTSFRRAARRRAVLAGVVFVVGIALLMTGVITQLPVVGIIGFVIMLGSATVGLAALRSKPVVHTSLSHPSHGFTVFDGGRRARNRRSHASFMDRMEQRWQRRRDGNAGW